MTDDDLLNPPGRIIFAVLDYNVVAPSCKHMLKKADGVLALRSHKEIAEVFGVKFSTVRSNWFADMPKNADGTYPTDRLIEYVFHKRNI